MVWKRIYRDFKDHFSDEKGIQESNLTVEESKGLEKLKKMGSLSLSRLTNLGSSAS